MKNIKNKSGQVTIFIIVGLLIVVAITLIFILRPGILVSKNIADNPQSYLESCAQDSLSNSEKLIFETNGFPEKDFKNYFIYNAEKIPFLCTVSEFYSACVPQEPALIEKINKIIENKAAVDLETCFRNLKEELEAKGNLVDQSTLKLDSKIAEDKIILNSTKKFSYTKNGDAIIINDQEFFYASPIFDLIKTTQTIVNYESSFCEFNELNWMKTNPQIKIERFRASDQTKIYTITDRQTESQIKFAIRTCLLPAGI